MLAPEATSPVSRPDGPFIPSVLVLLGRAGQVPCQEERPWTLRSW